MCIDSSEMMEKHLGLFHALNHTQALQTWVDLLSNYVLDLKNKGISDADVWSFIKSTNPKPAVQQEKSFSYLLSYILDKGVELHRNTRLERWSEKRAQPIKLPHEYSRNKNRLWANFITEAQCYAIDSILNDVHDFSLECGCDHFINLYSNWAHTIPSNRIIGDKDLNKVKEEDINRFAIGKSWEDADILEKRVQYYIENWDYRGIFDTLVLLDS
jgi:hypothetical protein